MTMHDSTSETELDTKTDNPNDSPKITYTPAAGTDITTGHAVDAFLLPGDTCDPWAIECFSTFADILINYSQTICPLPSKSASENLVDKTLPSSINAAVKRDLLSLKKDKTAESVKLTSVEIQTEYEMFTSWAKKPQNFDSLYAWVKYHFSTERIHELMKVHVPHSPIDEFWSTKHDVFPGINDVGVKHAFDMFARTVQYHDLLGSHVYFPHPLRKAALTGNLSWSKHRKFPSWGRYLSYAIESKRFRRDINEVFDCIATIKEVVESNEADWFSILGKSDSEQQERIEAAAADARLPGRLQESAKETIVTGIGIVASVLVSPYAPSTALVAAIALALGIGEKAAQKWNGNVPGALCNLQILRGSLEWPGLTNEMDH